MIVAAGRPQFESLTPQQAREAYLLSRRALQPDPDPVAEVSDLRFPGPGGPISLRCYRGVGAGGTRLQPALVYIHGGGFVVGNLDSHDQVCRALANAIPGVVVAVDYRLAPEHKFPAAVDDAVAATRWIARHASSLGIDATRLAVGGDSAGGNLAAVVALTLRDAGGPALCLQLLIYPATDMRMDHPSHFRHAGQLPLLRTTAQWFIGHYLNGAEDVADWRASPLRAPSLEGLPPALVITAGFDPLCDEGEAYAQALSKAGGAARLERFEGQVHGFFTMGRVVADWATIVTMAASALRCGFNQSGAAKTV
jgi:acetyl esterase